MTPVSVEARNEQLILPLLILLKLNPPALRSHVPLPKYGSHWSIHYKHWTETVHCHCRYHYCVDTLDSVGSAIFLQEYLFHFFGHPAKVNNAIIQWESHICCEEMDFAAKNLRLYNYTNNSAINHKRISWKPICDAA